jgi:hypothetical protein
VFTFSVKAVFTFSVKAVFTFSVKWLKLPLA